MGAWMKKCVLIVCKNKCYIFKSLFMSNKWKIFRIFTCSGKYILIWPWTLKKSLIFIVIPVTFHFILNEISFNIYLFDKILALLLGRKIYLIPAVIKFCQISFFHLFWFNTIYRTGIFKTNAVNKIENCVSFTVSK